MLGRSPRDTNGVCTALPASPRDVSFGAIPATAVPATFKRLMDEGLDRHEAIHAVGSVLMGIVFDVIRKVDDEANINAKYGRELAALTAASWRAQKD